MEFGMAKDFSELLKLVNLMKAELQIEDRVYRLRAFKSCFVGRDAVAWLIANGHVPGEAAAVSLGNRLLDAGLLHHVCFEHRFENRYLFYRLAELDEPHRPDWQLQDQHDQVVDRGGATGSKSSECLQQSVLALRRRVACLQEATRDDHETLSAIVSSLLETSQELTELVGEYRRRTDAVATLAARLFVLALFAAIASAHSLPAALLRLACFCALFLCAAAVQPEALVALLQSPAPPRPPLSPPPKKRLSRRRHLSTSSSAASLSTRDTRPGYGRRNSGGSDPGGDDCTDAPLGFRRALSALLSLGTPAAQARARLTVPFPPAGAAHADVPVKALTQHATQRVPPRPAAASAARSTASAASTGLSRSDFEASADRPLLVRLVPLRYQRCSDRMQGHIVPANCSRGYEFETDGFRGRVAIWVQGLLSSPPDLFEGMRRKSHVIVQGRFRRPMSADDVVTGQKFYKPLKNVPAPWVVGVLAKTISRLSSTTSLEISPRSTHLLTPVIAGAHAITVSLPGSEPNLASPPVEDLRLQGQEFEQADGRAISAQSRRRLMHASSARKRVIFSPDFVYTFHFWQHLLDLSKYQAKLGSTFKLAHHLNGQHLQVMAQNISDGKFLWLLELCHESMLTP